MAFARSYTLATEDDKGTPHASEKDSSRRKKLHILYLLNDLFHHTKYHNQSASSYTILIDNLQPHLADLFGHTSAYDPGLYVRHLGKVNDLLALWNHEKYYQPTYIERLQETVRDAAQSGAWTGVEDPWRSNGTAEGTTAQSKDMPYIMPAAHGDSSMPFYDLPAANMMPHISPNHATPINPQHLKPLHFAAGPADETLAAAVRDLLEDVDMLYGTTDRDVENDLTDIDALGQLVTGEEFIGEAKIGEGYYGWSKVFCERMKSKRIGRDRFGQDPRRNETIDSAVSPRKGRRFGFSGSSSDRSQSRSRPTSGSPSRSRSRPRGSARERRRSYSRSRSPSWTRPSSERRNYDSSYGPGRSRRRPDLRSRSRSYSPQPPTDPQQLAPPLTPALPITNIFNGAFPVPVSGFPVPPPPPKHYKGIWPPPPPPLTPSVTHGQAPLAQANVFTPFHGVVPPPPPPASPGQFSAIDIPPVPYGIPGHYGQATSQLSAWAPSQPGHSSGAPSNGRGGNQPGQGGQSGWTY